MTIEMYKHTQTIHINNIEFCYLTVRHLPLAYARSEESKKKHI